MNLWSFFFYHRNELDLAISRCVGCVFGSVASLTFTATTLRCLLSGRVPYPTFAGVTLVSLSGRVVVLESRPTENPTALSNLYILAGHENSY